MRLVLFSLALWCSWLCSCHTASEKESAPHAAFAPPLNSDRMRLFDQRWRFSKQAGIEAIHPDFDDSGWRTVHLPHDWSVEDLPQQQGVTGPFSKASPGGISTGFTMGGVGYYRKAFTISHNDLEKIFTIYFDGVYMESDIWINGHHLGFHPNGYTPFYYELTDYINPPGIENILVVRAKNKGQNSRWYSGSGIYRHVWLRVTDPVNIPVWGVYLKTTAIHDHWAKIQVDMEVQNQGSAPRDLQVDFSVVGENTHSGSPVFASIKPGERLSLPEQTIVIKDPQLWSPDNPRLYTLRIEVKQNSSVVDVVNTSFGIRILDFSPHQGFLLNGSPVILKGGCLHHDNGILGAASYDRAEQRKVALMKANGFNAIRTSHNPPSQQLLEACDRFGLLVIDEAFDRWEHPKKPDDYHRFFKEWALIDLQSMIMRDRNHPSIIAWSYGNEIYERADTSGLRIARQLIQAIKQKDDTRPVTQAICDFWEYPYKRPWSDTEAAFELMDIHGYNYKWAKYENDHEKFPNRIIVGTESFPMEVYENYRMAVEKPYVIGDFVWTAMDYLGEAGIGQASLDSVQMTYPWFNGYCGDIDLIGNKKPQSFYRDVVWGRSMLEMAVEKPAPENHKWVLSKWGWRNELPGWNWDEQQGTLMDVYVYTPADQVELLLNNRLVATKRATDSSKYTFHFKVPYEKGKLTATARANEKIIGERSIMTTGAPERIHLRADLPVISTNKNDLAYIQVSLLDSSNLLVRDDDRFIHFEATGAADLLAVGNGNPTGMKSFQADSCKTFHGRCLVILRPWGKPGEVEVLARSEGPLTGKTTFRIIETPDKQ